MSPEQGGAVILPVLRTCSVSNPSPAQGISWKLTLKPSGRKPTLVTSPPEMCYPGQYCVWGALDPQPQLSSSGETAPGPVCVSGAPELVRHLMAVCSPGTAQAGTGRAGSSGRAGSWRCNLGSGRPGRRAGMPHPGWPGYWGDLSDWAQEVQSGSSGVPHDQSCLLGCLGLKDSSPGFPEGGSEPHRQAGLLKPRM